MTKDTPPPPKDSNHHSNHRSMARQGPSDLIEFANNLGNLSKAKDFSKRPDVITGAPAAETLREWKKALHNILLYMAGGREDDIYNLLCHPRHGYMWDHNLSDKFLNEHSDEQALKKKLGVAFANSTRDGQRRTFLQFVVEEKEELKPCRRALVDLGFTGLGLDLLQSVRETVNEASFEYQPLERLQPSAGGNPGLSEEARAAIREHWWEHSAPTPEVYFTDLMWDDENPMRVMTSPPYHIAGLGVAKKLCKSKTTVIFHKPEFVCKPCRKTDYCRYCYRLRILTTRGKTHLCQLRTRYDKGHD